MAESEGIFELEVWERVFEGGERICLGDESGDDEDAMDAESMGGLESFLRDAMGAKMTKDQKWKEDLVVRAE